MIVVGGGNSAGQAAVFLAEKAKRVHMLVRSAGLVESMSRYLIRRIEEILRLYCGRTPRSGTLEGESHLESVRWQNSQTGQTEDHKIRNVFVMAGAAPNTIGLMAASLLTPKASLRQVPICRQKILALQAGPLPVSHTLLETSLPGIFAVGDVRGGSIKRVASAVGEGSIAISFIHQIPLANKKSDLKWLFFNHI